MLNKIAFNDFIPQFEFIPRCLQRPLQDLSEGVWLMRTPSPQVEPQGEFKFK